MVYRSGYADKEREREACQDDQSQGGQPMAIRKTVAALGVAALCLVMLVGCNTVKGIGQDLQSGAQTMQDTIDHELEQNQQW